MEKNWATEIATQIFSQSITSDIGKGISEYDRFYGAQDFNPATRSVKLPIEIKHAYYNHHFIVNDIKDGKGFDVDSINVDNKIPAIITGSGPTFDEFAPLFKEWKGAIFCSTSQASTLVHYGHPPEYIIALDPHTGREELDTVEDWKKFDSSLVCHPCISPHLVQNWSNRRLYFRPLDPTSEFHMLHLGIAYGQAIKTFCLLFSCTPAAQIALARKMGYWPLFLVGLDFGFPENKRRFVRYYWHELEGWQKDEIPTIEKDDSDFKSDSQYKRLLYTENGCCSSVIHIYYKRAFICVANIDMSDIIKVKAFNTLVEFPEIEAEELIETQGKVDKKYLWSREKKQRIYEDYLARYYTFALRFKNGNVTYFECSPDLKKHIDVLPPDIQERIKKGEAVPIEEQIERFVQVNFLKAKQVEAQTKEKAEDLLDVKGETKRLKEINKRARKFCDSFRSSLKPDSVVKG